MDGKREIITPAYEQLGRFYPETRSIEPAANAQTYYVFCKKGIYPPKCIPELCEDPSCDICPPGAFEN